jgi:hypothetical protein
MDRPITDDSRTYQKTQNAEALVMRSPTLSRCLRAVRSLSPVATIVVAVAILSGGFGIADAATGGTFILGRANHEISTASLSDSRGTPLSLSAPKGKAPLTVNRSTEVKNLNAQYVGGLSATAIKPSGGDDYDAAGANISLPPLATVEVASTGKLAAGTYYVTGTAQLSLATGDPAGSCFLTLNKNTDDDLMLGAQSGGPLVTVAETAGIVVPANGTLQEWCGISGSAGGSTVNDAAITAIRVLASAGSAEHGS